MDIGDHPIVCGNVTTNTVIITVVTNKPVNVYVLLVVSMDIWDQSVNKNAIMHIVIITLVPVIQGSV